MAEYAILLGIFVATLIVYVFTGIFASRYAKKLDEYYVMRANAPTILVMGTYTATWISAIGILALTGVSYKFGFPAGLLSWGCWFGFIIGAFWLGPQMRRFGAWTAFDFFGDRYDSNFIRILSVLLMFIALGSYLCAQIMGSAVALAAMLNMPYQIMVVLTVIIFIVITVVGGAWSVTVTDTLMFLIFVSAAIITFPLFFSITGWDILWKLPESHWTWNCGGALSLGVILGWQFTWMFGMIAAPHQISRALIAKDEWTFIKATILATIVGFIGVWCSHLVSAAFYAVNPNVQPSSAAFPTMAVTVLGSGLGGYLIAGIYAACLSTATTMLLVLGFGIGRDIIQRVIAPTISEGRVLWITRVSILGIGLIEMAIALLNPPIVLTMGLIGAGVFSAAYFPAMLAGCQWKRVTKWGAGISMFLGGCLTIIGWILNLSGFKWPTGLGPVQIALIVSVLSLVIISLLTKPSANELKAFYKIKPEAFSEEELKILGILKGDKNRG